MRPLTIMIIYLGTQRELGFFFKAKNNPLENKQRCVKANRPAYPNANINSCSKGKEGKGKWEQTSSK